jgi:mitochondrial fission protein ELM1
MPLQDAKTSASKPAVPVAAAREGESLRPDPARPVSAGDRQMPIVWLLMSDKTGDNAQLQVVADALPWPSLAKRIQVRPEFADAKPRVAASVHHVDLAKSDPLEAPWPDLVITIGRRMSMVALWVQMQSQGRTKIALIGPPKRLLDRFDLAVASVQYRLAPRPNLLRINFPLQRIDRAAIAAEAEAWRAELGSLRPPLIAVMVGGRTKAVRFDEEVARQLAAGISDLAAREKGTLVVTTSRRTPDAVIAVLERMLPAGSILHRWNPGGGRNPYRALLGLADCFVVTSDSVSMLMEIGRLGKPLAIYPLPLSSWLGAGFLPTALQKLLPRGLARRLRRAIAELGARLGAIGHDRDLTAIHRLMIKEGHAVWFGDPFPPENRPLPDELGAVVERVRALMERD